MLLMLWRFLKVLIWGKAEKTEEEEPLSEWLEIGPCDPTSEEHGEHHVSLVSRHHIAESGLICPKCNEMAAMRGDYSKVQQSRLGEVVRCTQCHEILVASPDTEHGDDKMIRDENGKIDPNKPDPEEWSQFKRIDQTQALKEQYGSDVEGSLENKRVSIKKLVENNTGIKWEEMKQQEEKVLEELNMQETSSPRKTAEPWDFHQNQEVPHAD